MLKFSPIILGRAIIIAFILTNELYQKRKIKELITGKTLTKSRSYQVGRHTIDPNGDPLKLKSKHLYRSQREQIQHTENEKNAVGKEEPTSARLLMWPTSVATPGVPAIS